MCHCKNGMGMGMNSHTQPNEVIKWGLIRIMTKKMVSKPILSKSHNRQIKLAKNKEIQEKL